MFNCSCDIFCRVPVKIVRVIIPQGANKANGNAAAEASDTDSDVICLDDAPESSEKKPSASNSPSSKRYI